MGSIENHEANKDIDSRLDIATIDISPLLSTTIAKDARERVLEDLRTSLTTTGFFQVVGHGVPLSLQKQVIECAEQFFALPVQQKNEVALSKAFGNAYRGYEEMGGQTSSQGGLPDLKEGFICDQEIPLTDPRAGMFLLGPNQWPAALQAEDFSVPLLKYRIEVVKIIEALLQAIIVISEGRLGDNVFKGLFTDPTAPLRLLHYPPQVSTDKRQFGTGAHADISCLTLLLQQPNTVGLQVWMEEKEAWAPVPVVEDAFVVNVGDMLQVWTGGYFRSAQHRVINSGNSDRYSAVLFFMGNLESPYTPVPNINKVVEKSVWDNAGVTDGPTTVGKLLLAKLQAVNFGESGKAVSDI